MYNFSLLFRCVLRLQFGAHFAATASTDGHAVADVLRLERALGLQVVDGSLRGLHLALHLSIATYLVLVAADGEFAAVELHHSLAVALLGLESTSRPRTSSR